MYEKRAAQTILWVLKEKLDKVQLKVYTAQYYESIMLIMATFKRHTVNQNARKGVLRL